MLLSVFAAGLLLAPSHVDDSKWSSTGNPQLVLSNVRLITCEEGSGTGWIIGKNIIVTAAHVASSTNCKDAITDSPLRTYKKDPSQDLALMTGALPDFGEYMKYSCSGYKPGWEYEVYAWSSMGYPDSVLRKHVVTATDDFTVKGSKYRDGTEMPVLRIFSGYTVAGNSGGPYTKDGITYGIVTAGYTLRTWGGLLAYPEVYSTDLKDTILCNRPVGPNTPQTH